jgi:hypothetical protein
LEIAKNARIAKKSKLEATLRAAQVLNLDSLALPGDCGNCQLLFTC